MSILNNIEYNITEYDCHEARLLLTIQEFTEAIDKDLFRELARRKLSYYIFAELRTLVIETRQQLQAGCVQGAVEKLDLILEKTQ